MRLRVISLVEGDWKEKAQELLVQRMSTGEGEVSWVRRVAVSFTTCADEFSPLADVRRLVRLVGRCRSICVSPRCCDLSLSCGRSISSSPLSSTKKQRETLLRASEVEGVRTGRNSDRIAQSSCFLTAHPNECLATNPSPFLHIFNPSNSFSILGFQFLTSDSVYPFARRK